MDRVPITFIARFYTWDTTARDGVGRLHFSSQVQLIDSAWNGQDADTTRSGAPRQWLITAPSQHSPLWANRLPTLACKLWQEFPLQLTIKRKCTLPTNETLKPESGNPLFFQTGKTNSGKRSQQSIHREIPGIYSQLVSHNEDACCVTTRY